MSKTAAVIPLLILIIAVTGCEQKEIGVMNFPDGKVQHVVRMDATPWQPCPPTLPAGCEMAVLDGSPQKSDLFTVRFNSTEDFFMPPHLHPKDERVTIISGKAAVGFGKDVTREQATEFGPGDYYVNARNEIHSVWIDQGTIVQITGIGPWVANFVNKDN